MSIYIAESINLISTDCRMCLPRRLLSIAYKMHSIRQGGREVVEDLVGVAVGVAEMLLLCCGTTKWPCYSRMCF